MCLLGLLNKKQNQYGVIDEVIELYNFAFKYNSDIYFYCKDVGILPSTITRKISTVPMLILKDITGITSGGIYFPSLDFSKIINLRYFSATFDINEQPI